MDKTNHISRIIADKVLGQELSGEDAREFEEWSKATTENEILFERVKSMRTSREILALEQEDYGEKMVGEAYRKTSFSCLVGKCRSDFVTFCHGMGIAPDGTRFISGKACAVV